MTGIVNGRATIGNAQDGTREVNTTARATLAMQFAEARAATLRLFDLVPREADLHESPGFGFRPIIWHLAHIGVFEAYWILQQVKGDASPEERYERVFDPIQTPREQSKELPSRREMEAYLARVRARVLDFLETATFDTDDALLRDGYVFRLVLEHERQHQETLAYLLQLLDPAKKRRPAGAHINHETSTLSTSGEAREEMIEVPAGEFELGAIWKDRFAYDNELPAHAIHVPAFKIDRTPVTNEEFAHFVAEGGYMRREFWDEEGWSWREKENWQHPLYWSRASASSSVSLTSSWRLRGMFGEETLPSNHPVSGISWYEAQAFAHFAGKRLPTEAEWERAASWDAGSKQRRLFAWGDDAPTDARCNFDLNAWGTTWVGAFNSGASAVGCLDMTGNVWEWTSSKFAGHPGFTAFPYPEYSEVWFDDDHRILKGGSWATSPSVLRTSFRNFFRRHFRIAFAGLRCAADA
jgi:iron(II)-dependent oxidoreductase